MLEQIEFFNFLIWEKMGWVEALGLTLFVGVCVL
jgi:hypothetical protein